jgi:hypothetical protein
MHAPCGEIINLPTDKLMKHEAQLEKEFIKLDKYVVVV